MWPFKLMNNPYLSASLYLNCLRMFDVVNVSSCWKRFCIPSIWLMDDWFSSLWHILIYKVLFWRLLVRLESFVTQNHESFPRKYLPKTRAEIKHSPGSHISSSGSRENSAQTAASSKRGTTWGKIRGKRLKMSSI